jgi:hypothetical protein
MAEFINRKHNIKKTITLLSFSKYIKQFRPLNAPKKCRKVINHSKSCMCGIKN